MKMQKGIFVGFIISVVIFCTCYFLFKFVYRTKGIGGAFLISSLPLLLCILVVANFIKSEKPIMLILLKPLQ